MVVRDEIVSVNRQDISKLSHRELVARIKKVKYLVLFQRMCSMLECINILRLLISITKDYVKTSNK